MTAVPVDDAGAGGRTAIAAAPSAVERLRVAFRSGRTRSEQWRIRQIRGVERLLDECEADIVEALAQDLRRPAVQAWFADLAPTGQEAAYARRHLRRWMRERRTHLPLTSRPGSARYRYEPLGVALVIGAWNYPVHLTLAPVIAALAAGNAVLIKPSEHAPATSRLLARLVPRYLDPEAVAVVEGEAAVTQDAIAAGVDLVFFTGGPAIGAKVMEAAAPHLTPVVLELGGKCPAIVTADADVEVAARRIAFVKTLNSGQTCVAPDYVLVERAVRDELVAALDRSLRDFLADGLMLPVAGARQFDRLAAALDGHGGTVVAGGGADGESATLEATLIVDPDPDSAVMQDEIFGPLLPILTVDSIDEAIEQVNSRSKPLALYLFSSSRDTERRVLDATSSGGAVVNHVAMHLLVPQLPFGGVGSSGFGSYHGEWGFQTFSHRRAILRKPARPDPSLLYPPYSPSKLRFLRRIF